MGFFRKNLGIDLTGGGQEDAARESARLFGIGADKALEFGQGLTSPFIDQGTEAAGLLGGAVFQGFQSDPSRVLDNPLFQALARDQEQKLIGQRAALGLGGSGGTRDSLTRNLLLLGNQFQQQDFSRQLQENQTRFGQLFNQTQFGGQIATQQARAGENLITGKASANAGVPIVAANVASAQGGQLLSGIGGALLGSQGLAGGLNAGQGFASGLLQ